MQSLKVRGRRNLQFFEFAKPKECTRLHSCNVVVLQVSETRKYYVEK